MANMYFKGIRTGKINFLSLYEKYTDNTYPLPLVLALNLFTSVRFQAIHKFYDHIYFVQLGFFICMHFRSLEIAGLKKTSFKLLHCCEDIQIKVIVIFLKIEKCRKMKNFFSHEILLQMESCSFQRIQITYNSNQIKDFKVIRLFSPALLIFYKDNICILIYIYFFFNRTVPPPISWAQRNDLLYVIIDVECKDIDYK